MMASSRAIVSTRDGRDVEGGGRGDRGGFARTVSRSIASMLVLIQFCSMKVAMSRWGDEKTLRFIQLYRERECLWNTFSPLYKNKKAREFGYKSILQTFNDKHLDLKSVKTKIKNLRSVYHTELKKVKYTARFGNNAQVYKPSLSWFDAMHAFLGDSVEDRGESAGDTLTIEVAPLRARNEIELKEDAVAEVKLQYEETIKPQTDHRLTLDSINDTHTELTAFNTANIQPSLPTTSLTSRQTIRTPNKGVINRKKRSHASVYNTLQRLENTVCNIVNMTKQQQQETRVPEDEFHMFALSVAAQLRQLPLHVAIATQNQIQNTLSEARLASIFSTNSSQPSSNVKEENANEN